MDRSGSTGPHDALARLERNLEEQVAAEERLIAAMDGQHEAMRRLSAEGLREALAQSAGAAKALSDVAAERRRLLDACGGRSAAGDAERAWRVVLDGAPADRREALDALRRRAHDLADRVAAANRVSGRVTERAVAHFAGLLSALAGGGPSTYAPKGPRRAAVRTGRPNSLIDRVA